MTNVKEEVLVNCPPQRAQTYLIDYLKNSSRDGGSATLRLTATIGSAKGMHATIEREAVAAFARPSSAAPLEYQLLIDWTPTSDEPLPRFNGIFRLQWDEDYGTSRLLVEGRYEPPLGVVGKAFDAAFGHRIATNTMKALLETLRAAIESAYRKDINQA